MKLRRKTAPRGRQKQREHEKVSESISVVLSDTDSSQSDSVEEMKKSASMKPRRKTAQKGRQQEREKVSENIAVVLSDTDAKHSDCVEEMKKSASMKPQRKTALRRQHQQQEHEKVYENISVVLSDTSSNHSDCVLEMKRPKKKSRAGASGLLSKEDERPLSIVEPQYARVQKISLAPGVMAEDTLGKLRLMANTSELRPRSPVESVLDESSTDLMVESGPSSPCQPVDTVRCKECESLFDKMRRQPTTKKKSRDRDPASLSCDEWILLKKWYPRRPNREKGLLWKSLSRIRRLSAQGSDSAAINTTQMNCSRPHVFQWRSLRRCKLMTSIQTDLSITKAKPRHRKRQRAGVWPPVGRWKYSVKRKSSINDTLSQQLYPFNLSVNETQEEKLIVDDQISRLNADHKQNASDASSKPRTTNFRGKLNKQEVPDGLDGTRRVLKFDDTPETVAVETVEKRRSPRQQHQLGAIRDAQNVFQYEQQEESEDSDRFRTPTDLFSMKHKIKRGNQKKVSGDTNPAVQKPNFKSMLIATLVKTQNQIIKESCK